jgi:YggT family protein
MFIFGNLFIAIAKILDIILFFFYWIILLRALVSWANPDPSNPFVQFLHRTSEPILRLIRARMPMGRMDFSPIIAFIGIVFLQTFLVATLSDIGYRMKQTDKNFTAQRAPSQNLRESNFNPVEAETQRQEKPFYQ